jgi:GAF domain-containing protein
MRRAIETRDPILIQDTLSDPLTRPVRERLEALDFHTLMVIPITIGRELMGLLCLRGADGPERFGRREINLCTAVARATAGALRDALPRREVA